MHMHTRLFMVRSLAQVRRNNGSHGFDLGGVVEQARPGSMNVVLFDLMQYEDADLCEAALSIVMSRSRRTEELCDTIRRTQMLDRDTFRPTELCRHLGITVTASDTQQESNINNKVKKHFFKKGLGPLYFDRARGEDLDLRTVAGRSRLAPTPLLRSLPVCILPMAGSWCR